VQTHSAASTTYGAMIGKALTTGTGTVQVLLNII
jgi:hypothetical protein